MTPVKYRVSRSQSKLRRICTHLNGLVRFLIIGVLTAMMSCVMDV